MILLWLSLCLARAASTIAFEPEPVAGAETVILVTDDLSRPEPGATVQVVHRPGLAGERQVAIGITDSRGRVLWTPELGGVARVRAGEASVDVVVARSALPAGTATLLGLLFAGGLAAVLYGFTPHRRRRAR